MVVSKVFWAAVTFKLCKERKAIVSKRRLKPAATNYKKKKLFLTLPNDNKKEERMERLFKKLILAGIGALDLTREKAEEVLEELAKKGEIAYEEKGSLLEEAIKKGKKREKEIEERIEKVIKEVISRTRIATVNDIKTLEEKIEKLQRKRK